MSGEPPKGLILAAPHSGCGKTLLSAALLRHCREARMAVFAGKSGPDYIDPLFHRLANPEAVAVNIDAWAMRAESLRAVTALAGGKILLIEGAMGLYDGAGGTVSGSTADLAEKLRLPVVLILPAKAQSRSLAALLNGFITYGQNITIAGVILNGVGSESHAAHLEAILVEEFPRLPVLGALPWSESWHVPSRHLGLVTPDALNGFEAQLQQLAAQAGECIAVDEMFKLAKNTSDIEKISNKLPLLELSGVSHLAVARDAAFCFLYEAQLRLWQQQGVSLSFFSPLADEAPHQDADMVFLPGGYPELFAGKIAAAGRFFAGLRQAEAQGAWIYGECGGYMALGAALIDQTGVKHEMAGLLPHVTAMNEGRRALGYRKVTLADEDLPFASKRFCGHEFHYSAETSAPHAAAPLFASVSDAQTRDLPPAGMRRAQVFGSYIHLIDSE